MLTAAPTRDFGYYASTSFARDYFDTTTPHSVIPETPKALSGTFLGSKCQKIPGRATLARDDTLKSRFRAANDVTKRRNGGSEDGMFGGIILDALFTAAFPCFTPLFHTLGGFGATDMVDVYDRARDAFTSEAGRKVPKRQARNIMPPPRRKKSLFALIWG